ncbi:conjugal transfer protein [Loigolactobacillus coryniformis]|uniref:Conjugative transposon protein TcpC n=3 Tax=Loigolactobacillus TaxID=2767889 RepID=A0A1K2I401_9LACO|nr:MULTISPECIES: conjugal transfer protein [Lactobacillaceae]MCI2020538.1 conjugal transfer protein [Lentilactobacillus buchneri]MDC4185591.1 conjugal transfer protein [Loigolactobacillus coryniformis]PIO82933.1 conjugal transfer protein [Loigolactobacillus backii]SFZ87075.1 hypothetical protein LREN565_0188 [Loigolactobacillus rennini]
MARQDYEDYDYEYDDYEDSRDHRYAERPRPRYHEDYEDRPPQRIQERDDRNYRRPPNDYLDERYPPHDYEQQHEPRPPYDRETERNPHYEYNERPAKHQVASHKKARPKRPRKKVKRQRPPKRQPKPVKEKKPRKLKQPRVGIRRKTTWFCWLILIASVSFGVYKDFTAINKHTVHEREVVKVKLTDTNAIEAFVTDFAKVYYTWEPNHEKLETRQKNLSKFMLNGLVTLNADALRSDIPTSSIVSDIRIWKVEAKKNQVNKVLFTVNQQIKNSQKEDAAKAIESTYSLNVMKNKDGDMVIVTNPTIAAAPTKAKATEKQLQTDSSIDAETTSSITKFLTTFFTLYPSGTASELKYYVDGGTKPLNKDYRFAELVNPTFHRQGDNIRVDATVRFLDSETDMTQYSQYTLILEKAGTNWTIKSGL